MTLIELYKETDKDYQFAYAAYCSGTIEYKELKQKEAAKKKAFAAYAKDKKKKFNL